MHVASCVFQSRWRISFFIWPVIHGQLPEVESCVNIPEVEGGKQCVKMSSMVYWMSTRALTYRKWRGVNNVSKWVVWKEKMTTWTFHVLKAWNGRISIVRISYEPSSFLKRWTEALNVDGSTQLVNSKIDPSHRSWFTKEDNTYLSVKLRYSI